MPFRAQMRPRSTDEAHRVATPLELFFDLTFVVAVAQAASGLHHELAAGHVSDGLVSFLLAFFGIWWAWMNFTWFASAYDVDDVLYRLMVFLQMTGVLVFAAGIPRAFDRHDFAVMVLGYVVMRLAMVGQWVRAARGHPECRRTALRYAAGIAVAQVGWVAWLLIPGYGPAVAGFLALGAVEMLIPIWAERAGTTSWHPGHVAERFGLFTIIVLGESILAATVGVQTALDAESAISDLAGIIVGGLLTVFALWWIFFDMPREQVAHSARSAVDERASGAFVWGYGHYFVFAAAAASGAGIAVAVDGATDHASLSDVGAALAFTAPVAVFIVATWLMHRTHKPAGVLHAIGIPVTAGLILASSFTPEPVLLTGLLLVALVALALRVADIESRSPA